MDYVKALGELYAERERLTKLIAVLEDIQSGSAPGRRGRKSMPAEERRQVSERMKMYWASRRAKSSKKRVAR